MYFHISIWGVYKMWKSHRNKTQMQNVNAVSKRKFHVLSSGAPALAVSLILCTGKWIKLDIH
jgi:hypothetical protein